MAIGSFSDDEEVSKKKKLTPKQALVKMMKYCAYQERSQHEVRQKLYEHGLYSSEVEEIISELIVEGFVNEERFAIAFAGGKFRVKAWGRIKIKHALQQHKISEYCMKKAMQSIEEVEYLESLKMILQSKWNKLKGKTDFERKNLTARFAQTKGYESELIWQLLREDKDFSS
jgi:regulatory protein